MATFFGRRYARGIEAVGRTEMALGLLILLMLVGIIATFIVQTATNTEYLFEVDQAAYQTTPDRSMAGVGARAEPGNPFPDPGVQGWAAPARVSRYTPETLYKKIDGRAEVYLHYGVVGLTLGTYRHATEPNRTIDVYYYDMGTPKNALGIYEAEAPPDAPPAPLGHDAYQVGSAVFFRRGADYVQVLPTALDDDAAAALSIATRLDARIEHSGK